MVRQRDRPQGRTESVRARGVTKTLQTGTCADFCGIAALQPEGCQSAGHPAAETGIAENHDLSRNGAALQDPLDPIPAELRRKQQTGSAELCGKDRTGAVMNAHCGGHLN